MKNLAQNNETNNLKTLTSKVKKNRPEFKILINAVLQQGNFEELHELEMVVNHGANVGISGFIYYNETHAFTLKNKKQIVQLLEEQADSFGEDVVSMVSNFGIFRSSPMDNDDKKDLYKLLGGGKPTQGPITNVMAWFALEEVARWIVDENENND